MDINSTSSHLGGMWDADLRDFPRLAGETDDSPRIMRAISAAPNGIVLIPKGEYEIAEMLLVTNHASLDMHPAAHLKAVRPMKYVVFWDGAGDYHALSVYNEDGSIYDNQGIFIRGGDIDGNGIASCLAITNSHHFTLKDTCLHNGKVTGLCVTRETGGHLYELVATNVYCKTTMKGLAGNIGIDCQVSDCHFIDCFVIDYTISIRVLEDANRFIRCHVWGGTIPPKSMSMKEWSDYYAMIKRDYGNPQPGSDIEKDLLSKGVPEMLENSINFDIRGGGNTFDCCYADTAEIGFNVFGGDNILQNCRFFNNPRMGLRKSTAVVNRCDWGTLTVAYCGFAGAAGTEKLYEGDVERLVWIANTAGGGDAMAEQNTRLLRGK